MSLQILKIPSHRLAPSENYSYFFFVFWCIANFSIGPKHQNKLVNLCDWKEMIAIIIPLCLFQFIVDRMDQNGTKCTIICTSRLPMIKLIVFLLQLGNLWRTLKGTLWVVLNTNKNGHLTYNILHFHSDCILFERSAFKKAIIYAIYDHCWLKFDSIRFDCCVGITWKTCVWLSEWVSDCLLACVLSVGSYLQVDIDRAFIILMHYVPCILTLWYEENVVEAKSIFDGLNNLIATIFHLYDYWLFDLLIRYRILHSYFS